MQIPCCDEDAQKKGSGTYLLRSTKGYADIVKRGSNTTIYVFQTKNIQSLHTNISIADLVTRVRVIGQKEDNGKSRIEATLNGLTKYGIRQKIYIRGSEESLKDAKSAAQEILDENGTIKEDERRRYVPLPFFCASSKISKRISET